MTYYVYYIAEDRDPRESEENVHIYTHIRCPCNRTNILELFYATPLVFANGERS